jgi:hypothetical protein
VSDVDGDALTCSIAVPPVHGTLSNGVDEDCDRTYAPAPDYHGPDSLSFRVSDGKLASKVAMVRFTVHPVQDAPVAGDQALETEEDTPLAIALDASDVDGEALACEVVTGPEHGTLSAAADCSTKTRTWRRPRSRSVRSTTHPSRGPRASARPRTLPSRSPSA